LKCSITREEFEASIGDVVLKIDEVLDRILKSKYIDEVSEVEILGGGLRVPLIKNHLEQRLKKIGSLGSHLNADEAMAFGAAYMAANYSTQYKVPKIYMY
jgi:hypoxia up-regulated 1